ncbi:MAG: DUF4440 domain-containing protein, partial [Candidatus Aminicenantaceae bacterium]
VSTSDKAAFQGGVISGSESADAEADVAAIRSLLDDWDIAEDARDFEKLAAFLTEDAVSISHGTPALVLGREDILDAYKQELEQYKIDVAEQAVQDVRASGDLGMAWGVEAGSASPKDGGDPIEYDIKWLAIFARQDNGSWVCICDISNRNK